LGKISWTTWSNTQEPSKEQTNAYDILMSDFGKVYEQTKQIIDVDLPKLYEACYTLGIPSIPGKLPEWKK
jgi:hypothetical protein